jgi:diguanylate cyclase (GGDEF)-like protein/PAS domain S-box-containing protein
MKSQENTGLEKHDQQLRSEAGYQKNIAAGAGKDRLGEVVQLSDVISQFNETKATFDRVWKVLEERVTERAEQLSQQNLQLQQEIVERKQVQQALLESEKRFRELAETIQDVFWVGTPDWREVFYVSPAYEKIWGQSCDSLYEQPLSWLDPLPKEDRERVLSFLKEGVGDDRSEIVFPEYRVVQGDGSIKWIAARAYPIHDDSGTIIRVAGIAEDITERKNTEDIIQNIAAGVGATTGEKFFRNLVTRIATTLGVKYALVAQLIPDNRCQTLAIVSGNEILINFDYDLKDTPCENVLKQGLCCYLSGVCAQFPKDDLLQDMEIESYIGIPLRSADQRSLGLLVAMDTKPLQKQKLAGTLLEIFAARAAAELERVHGERQLQLAANVFENIAEGVVVTDIDGNIVAVNKAVFGITGYGEEEILGQNPRLWKSQHHDAAFYQAMWSSLAEEGHWCGEVLNRRKNGEVYPSQMTITALRSKDGNLTNYVSVFSDISMAKESQEKLEQLAQYDQLTQLPNRRLLHDRLKQALRVAERRAQFLGLLLLDLDNFKSVNDCLGHKCGDLLLIQVAKRLLACMRESDTVARLGGDEFVVLLPDCKSADNLTSVARKILEELATPFDIQGNEVFVSASIGVTIYPDDGNQAEILLKNADTAMYHIKHTEKNNFQFFTASMQEHIVKRLQLISELRRAMEREEFVLYYQPKMDLVTGRISGMEALIRWQHPDNGLIAPADFIPLAEETGIIVSLGKWALRKACLQTRKWQQEGVNALRVSVNLSARQFQDEELVEMVGTVIRETAIEPGFLELEITETTVMRDIDRTIEILWQLRDLGILLSIDDFGTGYSSLNYLKRLPLDILKIDKSFVRDVTTDPNDKAIVEAIVSLSHHLKMKVVAEGVETEEQLDFLKKERCHEVQGYYIARPLPAEDFKDFIQRHTDRASARRISIK